MTWNYKFFSEKFATFKRRLDSINSLENPFIPIKIVIATCITIYYVLCEHAKINKLSSVVFLIWFIILKYSLNLLT